MEWNFDNSYLKLPKVFYSYEYPDSLDNPEFVLFNNELAKKLNIEFNNKKKINFLKYLFKNKNNEYLKSFSQAYAGHQFGHFVNLGDGRAHIIGEHITKNNERFDIQLKGSGKTPFSRNGDGKATLGTMVREFIISESMHYLNIPTTRSLGVINTGEKILRNKHEDGGILIRVAQSHIRFGTFQFASIHKDKNYLTDLTQYTINRHFPELINKENKIEKLLNLISINLINLIINWLRVGFIHGVMNTDNMSIVSETMDYGPCAFMDSYNPKTVFSSIDHKGRYSYENQANIGLWNLIRFTESILLLIDKDEKIAIKKAEKIIKKYQNEFNKSWLKMMKNKIGLNEDNEKDIKLINELLDLMHVYKFDYTNTFVDLKNNELIKYKFFNSWLDKYKERIKLEKNNEFARKKLMEENNPTTIPRNHLIEKIIKEAESNKLDNLYSLLNYLKNTYNPINTPTEFNKPPSNEEKIFQTFCGT